MAEAMLARVLRDAGQFADSEQALARAETDLATLEPEPEGLRDALRTQRQKLCALASELALPRCAGVPPPPTE